MFNTENHIGADLHVVAMQGYKRDLWGDQTGLAWIPPSPNLRTVDAAILYPGVALLKGANISVGRGTTRPFELVGAPWISAKSLLRHLAKRKIAGARLTAADFTPNNRIYRGEQCHGLRIVVSDRAALRAPLLGIELAAALHRLYPRRFQLDQTLRMISSRATLAAIARGEDPRTIAAKWHDALAQFMTMRAKYLIYR